MLRVGSVPRSPAGYPWCSKCKQCIPVSALCKPFTYQSCVQVAFRIRHGFSTDGTKHPNWTERVNPGETEHCGLTLS